jgi:hypothetical protein
MAGKSAEKGNLMNRQIFVQSEFLDDIAVLEVSANDKPAAVREQLLKLLPDEAQRDKVHIYLEDQDDEGAFEKLKEIPDGLRVQLHREKGIDVVVRYAGHDVRRSFRPSATVLRIKQWATQEMGIQPSDAAELMLQVAGTSNRPDPDVHLGSLAKGEKSLTFDLVPSPRVNGASK